jgi:hypothetical protein
MTRPQSEGDVGVEHAVGPEIIATGKVAGVPVHSFETPIFA